MPRGGRFPELKHPVAIFDAGIGSYAAVAALQRLLPDQDIVYLADRASFPYGGKNRPELLSIMRRTLSFLDNFSPAAVLVASNAPSITVLDDLKGIIGAPVFGVRPPIRQALAQAGGGEVAVLGVQSMIESPELRAFTQAEAGAQSDQVHLVNASPLVELVESGAFLFAPDKTARDVGAFLNEMDRRTPGVSALTLSSTHLPWLRSFFEKARPTTMLFDPLQDAIQAIAPCAVSGTGTVLALVTEDARYKAGDFAEMLARLGVTLELHVVTIVNPTN